MPARGRLSYDSAMSRLRVCLVLLTCLAVGASAQGGGVTLRPGDVIAIRVYPDSGLSDSVTVDDHGQATFRLLGPRRVAGIPWPAVRDSVAAAYARELRDPVLSLTPLRRIAVLGAVKRAGVYLVDPTMSFATVIALAEGAAPEGDLRRVRVVREGRTLLTRASVERLVVDADVRSGDQIFVDRRSWWALNSGAVVGPLISAVAIAVSVLAR